MLICALHRCIYVVDPASIMTATERRALSTLPFKPRLETPMSVINPPEDPDASPETAKEPLSMSPAEIRVIRRLSARCNVLPVIGHADGLTDAKLEAVKRASEFFSLGKAPFIP